MNITLLATGAAYKFGIFVGVRWGPPSALACSRYRPTASCSKATSARANPRSGPRKTERAGRAERCAALRPGRLAAPACGLRHIGDRHHALHRATVRGGPGLGSGAGLLAHPERGRWQPGQGLSDQGQSSLLSRSRRRAGTGLYRVGVLSRHLSTSAIRVCRRTRSWASSRSYTFRYGELRQRSASARALYLHL
jgi:hypothetical protein